MKFLWVFPALFLIENIFGGPRGVVPGVPSRHFIFVAMLAALVLLSIRNRISIARYALEPLGVLAVFLLWNIVWATAVPLLNGVPLQLAWLEAGAFLILIVPFLFLSASGGEIGYCQTMLRLMVISACLLAWVQLAIWSVGTVWPSQQSALRAFLQSIYHDGALYVGPMESGFFRVFWISSLWLLPAMFYLPLIFQNSIWRLVGFFGISGALLVSYSRGMWIGVFIGFIAWAAVRPTIAIHTQLRKVVVVIPIVMVLLGAFVYFSYDTIENRMRALTSLGDASVSERVSQSGILLGAWKEQPLMGIGYGGSAVEVRDPLTPFSYEVMPLALLMKLGILGLTGFSMFFVLVGLFVASRSQVHPQEVRALSGALVAFMVAAMSNPLLINFVGISVLAIILIHWVFIFRADYCLPLEVSGDESLF